VWCSVSRKIIVPENETHWHQLRAEDITSTEVSSLFGVSPYSTAFETWHRKKDKSIVQIQDNERMQWGRRLQDAIAKGIAQDHSLDIRAMNEYVRLEDVRLGSSFDYAIGDDGLLEIKNVDSMVFENNWIETDGELEAPLHIELQVQHQLLVSGRSWAYLGALVGGNRLVLVKREADENTHKAIKQKALKFWETIERGQPPSPDFEKDAEFIIGLNQFAEPGKLVSVKSDLEMTRLAQEYKEYSDIEKNAKSKKESIKAQILTQIGDAEKALGDGFNISASVIGPTEVSYTRSGYRNFKITWPKKKGESNE